jgi:hypothetical membrane protein
MATEQSHQQRENLALRLAAITSITVAALVLIINITHPYLPIHGFHSFGLPLIIASIVVPLGLFNYGYLRGHQTVDTPDDAFVAKGWRRTLNGASLSVAYAIFFGGVTIAGLSFINIAFNGLQLDRYTSAVVDGLLAGFLAHTMTELSTRIRARDIIRLLSTFLVAGVIISMVTNKNNDWWQANFSTLGTFHSNTFLTFNLTLILSGLLTLALSDYLLFDLRQGLGTHSSYRVVRWFFRLIGVCLTGVGLFPDTYGHGLLHILHFWSAYTLVAAFAVLIIGLPAIVPRLSGAFYRTSYVFAVVLVVLFGLFAEVHYFSLTAFELSAFLTCFSWMYLFLKTIDARRADRQAPEGSSS